jgi:hypothetical protein
MTRIAGKLFAMRGNYLCIRGNYLCNAAAIRYKNYTIRSVAWRLDKRMDEVTVVAVVVVVMMMTIIMIMIMVIIIMIVSAI